ncbi:DUF790 family protein [Rubrobacter taiwanensis]|uniref:DUF790 family protein n=1 Tax=Rubrobacter taiwanensis TaxID=185139 RepID=A0A4R1B891_9ACTN|nr:DUF790 family protein [Rubrobacter taiwanensis]TCJ13078.1 DUF790 family protein [Rubrobacter taiwanensis]
MLRNEHILAHVNRGRVVPHRLSADDGRVTEVAERLIACYESHREGPRSRLERELALLEEELGPRLDARRGFKVVRALGKLLQDRAEWAPPTSADPYHVRTRLFELAAQMPEFPAEKPDLLQSPTREDVISRVSRETGLEDPVQVMYADRQKAQILRQFERPTPEELISRYNLAQVQGVLYSARELVVDLGREADAELIFRYAKLMELIYRIELTGSGYRLCLDGPLSLFGPVRKYGLRIAKFVPGLMLTQPWSLSAGVLWRGREAVLELDSETSGLTSHYRRPGDEPGDEVRRAFRKAWERSRDTGGWELESGAGIIPLPGLRTALVPDFSLLNRETGELAHLEILGFWTERHLIDRAAQIREAGERGARVLVAAPEGLGATPEALDAALGKEVIWYKTRLDPRAVLENL